MRIANVVVSALGLLAIVGAAVMVWRWRRLPLRSERPECAERHGWPAVAADAAASFGAAVAAGVVAGVLVLGLGGRAVMRLLAATSPDAQGRLTEAGERVGEITTGGTIGFLLFVGVGGGMVTALGLLLVRRWLPRRAGPAGLVVGAILVGTLGVLDPLSPDNVDFAILRPTWLAIASVAATGLLFAVTFCALAARLDAAAAGGGRARWLPCAGAIPMVLVPPFVLVAVVYVVGRAVAQGRVSRTLERTWPTVAGRAVIGAATVATLALAVSAAARIATA